jgi:hypothetical protein
VGKTGGLGVVDVLGVTNWTGVPPQPVIWYEARIKIESQRNLYGVFIFPLDYILLMTPTVCVTARVAIAKKRLIVATNLTWQVHALLGG